MMVGLVTVVRRGGALGTSRVHAGGLGTEVGGLGTITAVHVLGILLKRCSINRTQSRSDVLQTHPTYM